MLLLSVWAYYYHLHHSYHRIFAIIGRFRLQRPLPLLFPLLFRFLLRFPGSGRELIVITVIIITTIIWAHYYHIFTRISSFCLQRSLPILFRFLLGFSALGRELMIITIKLLIIIGNIFIIIVVVTTVILRLLSSLYLYHHWRFPPSAISPASLSLPAYRGTSPIRNRHPP